MISIDHLAESAATRFLLLWSSQTDVQFSCQTAICRCIAHNRKAESISNSRPVHSIKYLLSSNNWNTASLFSTFSEKDFTRERFAAIPPRRIGIPSRRYRSFRISRLLIVFTFENPPNYRLDLFLQIGVLNLKREIILAGPDIYQ